MDVIHKEGDFERIIDYLLTIVNIYIKAYSLTNN